MSFLGPDRRSPDRIVDAVDNLAHGVTDLSENVKSERKSRVLLVSAVLALCAVVVVVVLYAAGANQRLKDLNHLQAANKCRSDLAVEVDVTSHAFLRDFGDVQGILSQLLRVSTQGDPAGEKPGLYAALAVATAKQNKDGLLYDAASRKREETAARCDSLAVSPPTTAPPPTGGTP